jgi:hypothetical protein
MDDKIELINIFWSQRSKMFLKSNAIRGLAEYRALQSRLNTGVNCVEAFEVMKLCFGKDFGLLKVQKESMSKGVSMPLPSAVIEAASA